MLCLLEAAEEVEASRLGAGGERNDGGVHHDSAAGEAGRDDNPFLQQLSTLLLREQVVALLARVRGTQKGGSFLAADRGHNTVKKRRYAAGEKAWARQLPAPCKVMLRSAAGVRQSHCEAFLQSLRRFRSPVTSPATHLCERNAAAAAAPEVMGPLRMRHGDFLNKRRGVRVCAAAAQEAGATSAGGRKGRAVFLGTPDIAARVFNQIMVRAPSPVRTQSRG